MKIRGGTRTLEFQDLVSVVFSWAGVKCPFCLSFLICKIAGVEPMHKTVVKIQEEMLCTVCVWSAVSARDILAFMVIEALKLVLLHHTHTFKHILLRLWKCWSSLPVNLTLTCSWMSHLLWYQPSGIVVGLRIAKRTHLKLICLSHKWAVSCWASCCVIVYIFYAIFNNILNLD